MRISSVDSETGVGICVAPAALRALPGFAPHGDDEQAAAGAGDEGESVRGENLLRELSRCRAFGFSFDQQRGRNEVAAENDVEIRRLQLSQDFRDRAAGVAVGLSGSGGVESRENEKRCDRDVTDGLVSSPWPLQNAGIWVVRVRRRGESFCPFLILRSPEAGHYLRWPVDSTFDFRLLTFDF